MSGSTILVVLMVLMMLVMCGGMIAGIGYAVRRRWRREPRPD